MSKEITKDLDGNRPFEERVFARFDAVDEYLRTLDSRVQNLDSRVQKLDSRVQNLDSRAQVLESRAYDTKPIWERALKEILESRLEFGELKTEVNELKREVKREVTNRLDQIQSIQLGNRVDIRDAQDRIDKLESRLA